jgi:hypothetical protein
MKLYFSVCKGEQIISRRMSKSDFLRAKNGARSPAKELTQSLVVHRIGQAFPTLANLHPAKLSRPDPVKSSPGLKKKMCWTSLDKITLFRHLFWNLSFFNMGIWLVEAMWIHFLVHNSETSLGLHWDFRVDNIGKKNRREWRTKLACTSQINYVTCQESSS